MESKDPSNVSIVLRTRVTPCERCENETNLWDRLAGHVLCPECIEQMMIGIAPPIREPVTDVRCAICAALGVTFETNLHRSRIAVHVPLCGDHLRDLAARRLDPPSFSVLYARLKNLSINRQKIFLLHDAFYDERGKALNPVDDPY